MNQTKQLLLAGLQILVPKAALRDANAEIADLSLAQRHFGRREVSSFSVAEIQSVTDSAFGQICQGFQSYTVACHRCTETLSSRHLLSLFESTLTRHRRCQWPLFLLQQLCCLHLWVARRWIAMEETSTLECN